jgi:hypothetical protein
MTRSRSFDGRCDVQELERRDRPKARYQYYVTGRSRFPFDMLRHDSAWPATGYDAALLEYDEVRRSDRSIQLRSYRAPTIDRWSSFGWSVGFAAAEPLRGKETV